MSCVTFLRLSLSKSSLTLIGSLGGGTIQPRIFLPLEIQGQLIQLAT
jgi:hypothetical protein